MGFVGKCFINIQLKKIFYIGYLVRRLKMMNNLVIDGPYKGKVFIGANKITNKVICHIRTPYDSLEYTYYRSKNGFRMHSWKKIY